MAARKSTHNVADVTIDGTISSATARGIRSLVYTSASTGYQFYVDSGGTFVYSKTTDGGITWGSPVTVAAATTHVAFDVWYDQWTVGITGTLIHTWYFDTTSSDVFYRTLDTSNDTLGTQRTVFTGASAVAGRPAFVSGTKARGGNLLCCFDIDAGTEIGTYRSVDAGVNWTVRTNIMETATDDWAFLFPGNEADNQDIWAIYGDTSANLMTFKAYDDSANTIAESASITAFTPGTDGLGQFPWGGAIRHSDGHLIAAIWSARDAGTADMHIYDMNGVASVVTKTDIVTDTDDVYFAGVNIDGSGVIRVAYNGKRDGSENLDTTTGIYYTTSTDGGTTWAAGDTSISTDALTTNEQVWVPPNGPKFGVSWRNGSNVLKTNAVNSVPGVSAYTDASLCLSHKMSVGF